MTYTRLTLGLVAGFGTLMLAPPAFSADGTVTVGGALTSATCTINGNAPGTATTVNITLPTLAASALANPGSSAGVTPFQLNLANCTGVSAQTHFESGPTVDANTGALKNQAPLGASNAQVQLLNNQSQPINLNTNANSQTVAIVNNAATMQYFARYYAPLVAATPGAVNTSVMFSMLYN
jgi:major type 1 subunit fimbrin (pilin)